MSILLLPSKSNNTSRQTSSRVWSMHILHLTKVGVLGGRGTFECPQKQRSQHETKKCYMINEIKCRKHNKVQC